MAERRENLKYQIGAILAYLRGKKNRAEEQMQRSWYIFGGECVSSY